jgi:hypothetical protein
MIGTSSPKRVVNEASSDMRSPTRFPTLLRTLEDRLGEVSDDILRRFEKRRGQYDWEALVETLAEEGNFRLVFDGESDDAPGFVMGDPDDRLRAAILVTDPVPAGEEITVHDTFYIAREGVGGWEVRSFDSTTMEVLFDLVSTARRDEDQEEDS